MEREEGGFGAVLRAHRSRAGLTQRELASRSGVSLRAIRYLEQNRVARPRRDSLRRLAEALELPGAVAAAWACGDFRLPPDQLSIGVLGPLTVTRDGVPLDLGPAKQRCLFALLALRAGEVVDRAEIIDVLWGDRPPASCSNLVHTYVSGLRKVLEPERGGPFAPALHSSYGGYRLDAADLDLARFDDLARRARASRFAEPQVALALFAQALREWRGPVLAGLPPNLRAHPVALAVSSRRLATAFDYADTALAAGEGARAVGELQELAGEEPWHEGLSARLMLALAASGQQAAALALFAEVRQRLADELGVEPGAELRAAHLRVVRGELGCGEVVPAQLPADVDGFAGRAGYLARLDEFAPATVLHGRAGVGKSALAVHWAHRVRVRFPDGQLYVNLRGYTRDPVRPLDVLTRFLRALGVPPDGVPAELEEAAHLYRTRLANRAVLVVLDNAADSEQVCPLLPGTATCLVTSRDRLSAGPGARRIRLDVLEQAEAHRLLAGMLGGERLAAEPAAVRELVTACDQLPLALRLAGANLLAAPGSGVAAYNAAVRAHGRLRELEDRHDAVRSAFDLSYARLDPRARRLFRLLSLVPADFPGPAAVALLGDAGGRRVLTRLVSANLVAEPLTGRFRLHDLLRGYAAERAVEEEGEAALEAALSRLREDGLGEPEIKPEPVRDAGLVHWHQVR
ncbi:BTAD domain-containing putative transcriptional regulator [Amycolatopsis magusensis]|uniref:BTAD domain-containing putative transcriptional regulator n=1 Tax=Amycolatopsis magusensis TaxID=882444 RepID=UPI0024A9067D|nr:BTAD domain-containing putative transcriptional regulator [Amycolatopsis magusensis]MDI5975106.1 BTAD domain-containing putative transcriptional regulator [Amycolatopsis magusensis]